MLPFANSARTERSVYSEIRNRFAVLIATLVTGGCLASCAFVDTDDLAVTLYPSVDSAIIRENDSVWVDFGRPMDKDKTLHCVSLSSYSGSVSFDKRWEGNRLVVKPVEGWSRGVRYALECEGTAFDAEGKSYPVYESVFFYAVTDASPPALLSSVPEDDSVLARDGMIRLTFSKPISDERLDLNVSISPQTDHDVRLEDGGTTIVISPLPLWDGVTRYRWSVSDELTDMNGVRLRKSLDGYFRTYLDLDYPARPTLSAADTSDTSVRVPIESLANGYGILLTFDEAIMTDDLSRYLSLVPDYARRYRFLSASEVLVYPDNGKWRVGEEHALTLKKGMRDASGNATISDYEYSFTPAIPVLSVVEIHNAPTAPVPTFTETHFLSATPPQINVGTVLSDHTFTIRLSEPFSPSEAERLVEAISVKTVFPPDAKEPLFVTATMNTVYDNSIDVRYDRFTEPDGTPPEERVYYKLTIEGGDNGFILDSGAKFQDDFVLLFEVVE